MRAKQSDAASDGGERGVCGGGCQMAALATRAEPDADGEKCEVAEQPRRGYGKACPCGVERECSQRGNGDHEPSAVLVRNPASGALVVGAAGGAGRTWLAGLLAHTTHYRFVNMSGLY